MSHTGENPAAAISEELDIRVTLEMLLDARVRQLIDETAQYLDVGVHLINAAGRPLLGSALPSAVSAMAGAALRGCSVEESGVAQYYQVQQLLHEGETLGVLAVGPAAAEQAAPIQVAAQHISNLIEHLLTAGLEKLLATHMHVASMEHAYAELQQKNVHLAAAVERLQELDRLKSRFLATVSHELRTPLTSVLGYAEMLLEGLAGSLTEAQQEYVRTVMEKGEQLLSIITGILDISRIEAGGVSLSRSRFALSEVVQSALNTVRPQLLRRKIAIECQVPPSLPAIDADRGKIRQVLLNLLSNAIKFTPEGGKISLTAEEASLRRDASLGAEPRGVQFVVADSGIGIPPEALSKIFEPFYQVDGSPTRQFGGTGLGLAIVKSFIHAHGGSVWAESTPDQGSRFYVTLPIASP